MKVKTSELTGRALDHCVHLARGFGYRNDEKYGPMYTWPGLIKGTMNWDGLPAKYGSDWAQGGPIIEREGLDVTHLNSTEYAWVARKYTEFVPQADGGYALPTGKDRCYGGDGPTPLIAAMRCFVASKLGDEVEVPEELV